MEEERKCEVIEYVLAEEGIGRKRDDRDSVLMIGDREHDILGAKQTGIHSMGVLYGYGAGKNWKKPERSGSRRHRDRFGNTCGRKQKMKIKRKTKEKLKRITGSAKRHIPGL